MATIRAFSAIRPNGKLLELELLKYRLEPGKSDPWHPSTEDCRQYLADLLGAGRYSQEESKAIYIYSQQSPSGRYSTGIWALTSLDDLESKLIIPHELILEQGVKGIASYRKQAGLEGSPVLLCYAGDFELSRLIELVKKDHIERTFSYKKAVYELWKVEGADLIREFELAFKKIGKAYIADGHQRLAAAAQMHQTKVQWISSVYMSFDQIQIAPYHRLVRPDRELDRGALVRRIGAYYQMSAIPINRAFVPEQKGTIGMYLSGIWYRLEPKADMVELFVLPDAKLLQDRIIAPGLGIRHPERDQRLSCFGGESGWDQLLGELVKDNSLIAFTLKGMSASEIRSCADIGIFLPPKSTFISPRMPFGVMMRDGKAIEKGARR